MGARHTKLIKAVLGPTNTGKTHLAIERLCAHSSGVMGFPLRLLAREVYDRVVAIKGEGQVALLTGEERIAPTNARYFLCTAESMPRDADVAFVAIDEAQLGADFERGHVFTDRMLNIRGRDETIILGSETLRPVLRDLVPEAEFIARPRFSALSYAGAKKLSRLPKRSAIVAFSAEEVYAVAEMIRRQRGGAAVVMGALSPRTRNAQVDMFQAGDVDYLVATDAIGMGLNLDVSHVAFASINKFDGRRLRRLHVSEMAQIAGRAGRHHRDGTFGVLGPADGPNAMTPEEIERIEQHRFAPIGQLYWRNGDPDYATIDTLIASLEEKPDHLRLLGAPEAVDLAVAKRLADNPNAVATLGSADQVARFWAACGQPDFRKLGAEHHARFVERIWKYLSVGHGHVPVHVFADALARLEDVQGDIEKLSGRIAEIRSWAYIAHRADWLDDPAHWAGRTAEVEARLSDALHERLTQRFVDRRTTALMRGIGLDERSLPVDVRDDGIVLVDEEAIGQLTGFHFQPDADARFADKKMLIAAAERRLGRILAQRAGDLERAADSDFAPSWDEKRGWGIAWQGNRVAGLVAGKKWMQPTLRTDPSLAKLSNDDLQRIETRLKNWLDGRTASLLAPLDRIDRLASNPKTPALLRALYGAIVGAGGVLPRKGNDSLLMGLSADQRRAVRQAGVIPGSLALYLPRLIKPVSLQWLAFLRMVFFDRPGPLGEWHGPWTESAHPTFYNLGARALRVDLAERIITAVHNSRTGRNAITPDRTLATSLGMQDDEWRALLRAAGFRQRGDVWAWKGLGVATKKPSGNGGPSGSGHFSGLSELVSNG